MRQVSPPNQCRNVSPPIFSLPCFERLTTNFGRLVLATLAASLVLSGPARAGDCDATGLEETLEVTSEGIDWDLFFTDSNTDPNFFLSASDAQKLIDSIGLAKSTNVDKWSMNEPYLNTKPTGNMLVEPEPLNGAYNQSCITYDPTFLKNGNLTRYQLVVLHELMHGRQMQYRKDAGADDYGGIGAWVTEGTARCLDDRFSPLEDSGSWFRNESNRLMNEDDGDGNAYRDLPLTSLSYRACLFWSYACEQYGNINAEPDSGADVITRLWEIIGEDYADNQITDAMYSLGRLLEERGGPSFNEHWHRYTAAMMAREWDVSAVPNASWYSFIDETPAGGGSVLDDIARKVVFSANGPYPMTESGNVERYGHQFYEIPISGVDTGCEAIGIQGTSTQPVAWTLIGVRTVPATGDEFVDVIARRRGTEFARAVLHRLDAPYSRLGVVVAGLANSTDYEFTVDRGFIFPSIVRPNSTVPVYPGPADDPGRFLVRVEVSGPSGLEPDGVGNLSIAGLTMDHFNVKVGAEDATILSSGYVGTEYWLVCQAPEQAADGDYDLHVELCAGGIAPSSSTELDAVVYGDIHLNHMLVLDRSGSMAYPDDGSGSKLDAAKNAISLYTDAVNDSDRIGLVYFSGDGVSCTDDATTAEPLDTADANQRSDVKNAIVGLNPDGYTSIGDGMWDAQDEFDALPAAQDQVNWLVLLSDGEENETRYWGVNINCPGDLGDNARDRIIPSETRVNAMAFGPEADTALMEEIGMDSDGDYSYIPVAEKSSLAAANSSLTNPLTLAYINALRQARGLEELYRHEQLVFNSVPFNLEIEVGEKGLTQGTFYFNFDASSAAAITLRDPDGTAITGAQATIYTVPSHKVYHIKGDVTPGVWTAEITPAEDSSMIVGLLAKQGDGLQMLTDIAQINTGGAFGAAGLLGTFEWGVPVRVLAFLTDRNGPCPGATLTATVIKPDGTHSCPLLTLVDDGTAQDGAANDGLYGAIFTDTTQAGNATGTDNDDPMNPNPGGIPGLYQVEYRLTKPNGEFSIHRVAYEWFNVSRARERQLDDIDDDGIPDPYEVFYGLNPNFDDSKLDPDDDGLDNLSEFKNGCNPFDSDTDDGGESDGSEVEAGQCPLDPRDDRLPPVISVAVENEVGDTDPSVLKPLANRLLMPVHPAYNQMQVYRSKTGLPGSFSLIKTLNRADFDQGVWYDEDLVDGQKYCYRLRALGLSGAHTRLSPIFCGIARENPDKPKGWVLINGGSLQTDSNQSIVSMNFSPGVDFYQISNSPILSPLIPPLVPVPADKKTQWHLDLPLPGQFATVYVRFFNSSENRFSDPYSDSILYDVNGDADNDGTPNGNDDDDDDDGIKDLNEILIYFTDPYNPDTDGDGASDGEEIMDGCSDPLDSDTDGDSLLDGVDPSANADADDERDVDSFDVAVFQQCQGILVNPGCACFDFDMSGVVDITDYQAFEQNVAGPND